MKRLRKYRGILALVLVLAVAYAQVIPRAGIDGAMVGNGHAQAMTNSATGTTANKLVKSDGSGNAIIVAITDIGNPRILGIASSGAGTSGTVWVTFSGEASCVFDSAVTAGNYIVNDTSTAGNCMDAGASYPKNSQPLGIVRETNGSAGTYRVFLFGPAAPPANEILVNAQTGTSYTYLDTDRAKCVTHSNGSAIAGTLPQAGASSAFLNGWYMCVQNRGVGTLTITPTTSTIDGAANLALTTDQGAWVFSDGTNYFTQRGIGGGGGMATATQSQYFRVGGCNGATFIVTADASFPSAISPAVNCSESMPFVSPTATAKQVMHTRWIIPANLTGNVSATFYAMPDATNANVAVHTLETSCISPGDEQPLAAPSYNTAQVTTAAWTVTALQLQKFTISAITLTNCAAGDVMRIQWGRDGAHASDSDTNGSELIGLLLSWAVSQ